jgi:ParB/RepB/Spo0J family partition protein
MAITIKTESGEKAIKSEGFKVRPGDVVVDWSENSRSDQVTTASVAEMENSLKTYGQLQPITCRRLPDGRPKVIAGFTRLKAALAIAEYDPEFLISLVVANVNDEEAFLLSIIENKDRNSTTPIDNAVNMRRLMDRYAYTVKQVSEVFGISQARVHRHIKLLGVSADIRKKVSKGELSVSSALQLASMDDTEATAVLKDAEAEVEAEAKAKPSKKPRKTTKAKLSKAIRKRGGNAGRGLAELRKLLSDREDPVSVALKLFLAGDFTDEELARVLDEAEAPVIESKPKHTPKKAKVKADAANDATPMQDPADALKAAGFEVAETAYL